MKSLSIKTPKVIVHHLSNSKSSSSECMNNPDSITASLKYLNKCWMFSGPFYISSLIEPSKLSKALLSFNEILAESNIAHLSAL